MANQPTPSQCTPLEIWQALFMAYETPGNKHSPYFEDDFPFPKGGLG